LCKASSISFHRRSRRREKNGGIFHTEVAKITKGHSNSLAGGAFGLEGRSTRLAGRTEEEFHTEIAKGHSNSSVSGAFGLNGRSIRLARQAEEEFHTEIAKIAKGELQFTGGGVFGLDGRSIRLARQAEEEFHTDVAKIAKGNSTHRLEGRWHTYSMIRFCDICVRFLHRAEPKRPE
jgi:hypothetical protein